MKQKQPLALTSVNPKSSKLTRRACVDIVPAIVMTSSIVRSCGNQMKKFTHYVMWNFPVSGVDK